MKKLLAIVLLLPLSGCAAMRRHPLATGIVTGIAVGATIAIVQNKHNSCPSTYDGKPYQGTPWGPYPCPQYSDNPTSRAK